MAKILVISILFKSVDCNLGILEYETYCYPVTLSSISSLISQYTASFKYGIFSSTGDNFSDINLTKKAENIPPPIAIPKVMNKQAACNPYFLK